MPALETLNIMDSENSSPVRGKSREQDLLNRLQMQEVGQLRFVRAKECADQEEARRQATEMEVAIAKEVSARAKHQGEVKSLLRQRAQDMQEMLEIEAEVKRPRTQLSAVWLTM